MRPLFRFPLLALAVGIQTALPDARGLGAQAPDAPPDTISLPRALPALDVSLEPLFEVGGLAAPEWAAFTGLVAAAFTPDGGLYLLDSTGDRVVQVDRRGGLVRVHDRRGDGPGEMRGASGLTALPDGRGVVWDVTRRVFVVLDGDDAFDVRLPDGSGIPHALQATADGAVLALPQRLTTGRTGPSWLSADGVRSAGARGVPLQRWDGVAEGEAGVRTLAWLPVPQLAEGTSIRRAFEPAVGFGVLADGSLAVHHGDQWRIEIRGPDGSPLRALSRDLPDRRTTDGDRERWLEVNGSGMRVLGSGGAAPREPPPPWFNPVIPAIRALAVDDEDRLWIERPGTDPTEAGELEVVTPEGRPLGRWDSQGRGLPDAFGPGGLVVWLEQGELDVPVARVARMRLGGG